MTLQSVEPMTEAEARRITERIRTALDRVATSWADLAERVAEAYSRRADLALGYGSWAEYAEAELRPPSAIAAEVRRELVGLLTAQGMSTRAIAPAVGVSGQRVRQIVASQVASDLPPAAEVIDLTTGEVLADKITAPTTPQGEPVSRAVGAAPTSAAAGGGGALAAAEPIDLADWRRQQLEAAEAEHRIVRLTGPDSIADPPKVVGLDGKTYRRAEAAPRRRALPDQFFAATLALTDRVEAVVRLCADDRFTQNAEKVATANRSDLIRARDALQRVIDQLPERNLS